MGAFLHVLKKEAVILLLLPFRLFPVRKNRILLLSDLDGRYAGNPKYLAEYLIRERKGVYELVFALSDPAAYPGLAGKGIRTVKKGSFLYFYFALTSRVFITDSAGYSYLPLGKRTLVVNTWHGGGAYKKFNLDFFGRTPSLLKNARINERKTGLMAASCERSVDVFGSAMLIPPEKLVPCGSPRNDLFFRKDGKRDEIRNKLGITGKKLCLYAPTFRRSSKSVSSAAESASYSVDPEQVIAALRERFGGEWVFAFRYHPKITDRRKHFDDAVRDLSEYDDMQELLLAADVLLNDYSSSMWDFALTGRPCFLFCEDLADYQGSEDFYTPIRTWPFPLAETMPALLEEIRSFDEETYAVRVADHYATLGSYETGHASEKLMKAVEDKISEKKTAEQERRV